jgi:UDPglucose--hexose-1-phosphate uridylyltransferase
MAELRRDPLTGAWVLLAPERAARPGAIASWTAADQRSEACPFCPGHEAETPPELLALPDPESGTSSWKLRVVPNKFPALLADSPIAPAGGDFASTVPAIGFHEVMIETPEHAPPLELDPASLGRLLWAWRERVRAHASDPRLAAALPFKNSGALAGASLAHPHSQLLLPLVPETLEREITGARRHFERTTAPASSVKSSNASWPKARGSCD